MRAFLTFLVRLLANDASTLAGDPTFIRTVYVQYKDGDSQGHFDFGLAIGEAMGEVIRDAWETDEQLKSMEEWTRSGVGDRIFSSFVSDSNRSFPLYTREVEGMAAGAKVPLRRMLVNQLREELAQWPYDGTSRPHRMGHCTDAYVFDPHAKVAAWGHNDDWSVYWRRSTYFIIATALNMDGSVKHKFGGWVYPGYLVGEQLNWNSYGLAWTANSLFPKHYKDRGVGTAWVARHMLESTTLDDLIQRASDPLVSTAINYNIGSLKDKTMWNLEVDTAGVHACRKIIGPYMHANQFKLLDTSQLPEDSSSHRQARWDELRPNNMSGIRDFLSDRKDPHWPVWRNHTGGDDCYTQITGIFDLERRSLSVWTVPAVSSAAVLELPLDFLVENASESVIGRSSYNDVLFL